MKARIIWTCPSCGAKYKWNWPIVEAESCTLASCLRMPCADCRAETDGRLTRDGETRKGRPRYRWAPL